MKVTNPMPKETPKKFKPGQIIKDRDEEVYYLIVSLSSNFNGVQYGPLNTTAEDNVYAINLNSNELETFSDQERIDPDYWEVINGPLTIESE